jgi:hypothetical protein
MLHAAQAAPCNTNDRLVDLATGCIAPARPTNSSTRPRTAAVAIITSSWPGKENWKDPLRLGFYY